MKDKTRKRACIVIDLTKAPYAKFGVGIKKGNPKRCLNCNQPIKRGETWSADTGAEEPDGIGRYTVIRHTPNCPTPQAHRGLQKARMRKGTRS